MQKLLITTLSIFASLLFTCPVFGLTAEDHGVVISKIQTGILGGASAEIIEITNVSDEDINIGDWSIRYNSATYNSGNKLASFIAPEGMELMLSSGGSALLISTSYPTIDNLIADGSFSGGMAAAGGHVTLLDSNGNEIDKVGYGTAEKPEMSAAPSPPSGYFLVRIKLENGNLQDTENNAADFSVEENASLNSGGLFEVAKPVDVCPNIPGHQNIISDNYMQNDVGHCHIDICENLDGLQEDVPEDYELLDGNCHLVPLENAVIDITELLPNPVGADFGNEFIEVYNPNDRPINLKGYVFQIGNDDVKQLIIKSDIVIDPQSYLVLKNDSFSFTLVNSTGKVRLLTPAGNTVGETGLYVNPGEGEAWAIIYGQWSYTTKPTPLADNEFLQVVEEKEEPVSEVVNTLVACPAGKERNPATNRCRNIQIISSASLSLCDEGEYRSVETNRCRKLAAATAIDLVPCRAGQERNPATNRCRNVGSSVQSAQSLKPCTAGQERNPATNRCRKITQTIASTSAGSKKPNPITNTSIATDIRQFQWPAVAILSAGVLGYGLYEWRHEIGAGFTRLRRLGR